LLLDDLFQCHKEVTLAVLIELAQHSQSHRLARTLRRLLGPPYRQAEQEATELVQLVERVAGRDERSLPLTQCSVPKGDVASVEYQVAISRVL